MAIHLNQIVAMEKVLRGFRENSYGVLLAPMQSGKTTTFRLIACEMLRQKLVERVVIFSGTSDTDLREQTIGDAKTVSAFKRSYQDYLTGLEVLMASRAECDLLDDVEVVWAQKLDEYDLDDRRTLYIWEESHYGQSQKQRVDKFQARVGIDATGLAPPGCYVLSVSATPFSELSDDHHLEQSKKITRLIPGKGYTGVKQLKQCNKIHSFKEAELPDILAKYQEGFLIIRAQGSMETRIEEFIVSAGFAIERFDMSDSRNLNDIVKHFPKQKTVVLIKGKLRMGKVLNKEHVRCVIETAKQSKTDTVLQGLLGRCCGYNGATIDIYIQNLKWSEIDRFIELFDGNMQSLPKHARNISKSGSLVPCIPIRVKRSDDRVDEAVCLWEDICRDVTRRATAEDIRFHEDDTDPFWNGNTVKDIQLMRQRIKERCFEANHNEAGGELFLVHGTGVRRSEESKKVWKETMQRVKTAFREKKAETGFGSAGAGAGGDNQLVVWYTDMELYITMQFKGDVPKTTKKEVFCRKAEYVNDGFGLAVPEITRTNAVELEKTLKSFIKISCEQVTSKKITCNGVYNCIHLTQPVFKELTAIKNRFQINGVELSWKMASGRKPKDCTDARLAEISWVIIKTVDARAMVYDEDIPLAMLVQ